LTLVVKRNEKEIGLLQMGEPGLGFFSFNTAWRTIRGYETMNMIRKGQIAGIGRSEIQKQVKFVSNLFGIAA
jgi:hypothetical protein